MKFTERIVELKNGIKAAVRTPEIGEAGKLADFLKLIYSETEFMARTADETPDEENEFKFLNAVYEDENAVFFAAYIDGEIAGSCYVRGISDRKRYRHRAQMGISVRQKFWNIGLGSALLSFALEIARSRNFTQLELETVSSNERAVALYKKFGFAQTGIIPHAHMMNNGTYADYLMFVKFLGPESLLKREIPLAEFDSRSPELFNPSLFYEKDALPEKCVIAFFGKESEEFAREVSAVKRAEIKSCTAKLPVYVFNHRGEDMALVCGFLGSAGAAAQLEELICMGAKKFIAVGAAGTLTKKALGAPVIVQSAVRDEGASYHYMPPSYEVKADRYAVGVIKRTLTSCNVSYVCGKTWTTDGLYRETADKVAQRRSEGCITVEMEASALIAVSSYRGAVLGQLLYCGDDLSGSEYDHRNFFNAVSTRLAYIKLAVECCKNL